MFSPFPLVFPCFFYLCSKFCLLPMLMTLGSGTTGIQTSSTEIRGEFCDTELFQATCPEGSVIVMNKALYGRMKIGRCVETDMGFLGCHSNVLDIVDRKCSGRQECSIRVPDPDMESTRPCLKELKTYLEVSYNCTTLIDIPYHQCNHYHHINTTLPSGWLASTMTWDHNCGGPDHPWVITVKPGQKINLTLYDFSVERAYPYIIPDSEIEVCHEYAIVRETDSWDDYLCGGVRRIKQAYISKGSKLEIHITNKDKKYFMIYYEALGCGDLGPLQNGWFERREDGTGSAGCLHDNDNTRVELQCKGTEWKGVMPNCSQPAVMVTASPSYGDMALPVGASVAIIICAALLVGVAVVIIGLIRFRTLKDRNGNCTTPMESINLHEKPIHPQPTDLTRDLTDCAVIDPTSPPSSDTITINTTPRLIRHQRTVKINGNEYAHIWESPVPPSDNRHNPNAACCSLAGPSANNGGHLDCSHYRAVVREPTATIGKNTTYLFRPPHGDCFHLYGATTAHGTMPKIGPQSSPIRHIRNCPQNVLSTCDPTTTRYSSLESKENALNNSTDHNAYTQ